MSDAIHISGAGPAGLAAAITIARAGGRAVVHERQTGVGMRFHGDYQGIENSAADGAYGVVSDELAPKGYAYLIVHAGRGTLATVLFEDFHSERMYLERTLDFYKSHVGIPMTNARRFGGRANAHVSDRATRGKLLYVGEAAGFQDALWGFGMRYAMLSGHLAGRALVDASPAAYDLAWEARLGDLLRTSIVNRYIVNHIGNFGYSVALALAARPSDLRSWLHRLYAPSWWTRRLFPLAQRWARLKPPPAACVVESCTCTWCRCQHESESETASGGTLSAQAP